MKTVVLYTDGACSGNPGAGGWGAILMCEGRKKELSGGEKDTTNNRMELTAVIEGLNCIKIPCEIEVYSDSAYLINAFQNGWIYNWRRNGWRTAQKEEVKNSDLWLKLLVFADKYSIKWFKVKGHSDNEFNNRCDALARGEIKKIRDGQ